MENSNDSHRDIHLSDKPTNELTTLLQSNSGFDSPLNYGGVSSSYENPSVSFVQAMSSDDRCTPEEALQIRLKYFFMNPIEKWRAKGKIPWKLSLQVVKIIFVTVQLCVFGSDGYIYELQKQNTGSSFRHVFLKDWGSLRDVVAYPPSTGPYAVYTKPEFYDNVNYVIRTYANITNLALGTYCYNGPNCTMTYASFCWDEFTTMITFNGSVTFDGKRVRICHNITEIYPVGDDKWNNFSIEEFLTKQNDSIAFEKLISVDISFSLKSILLKSIGNSKYPDCYKFQVVVNYDNNDHDGQMIVSLDLTGIKLKCYRNGTLNAEDRYGYVTRQILNSFIIGICLLSFMLCLRMVAKAKRLCNQTDSHFLCSTGQSLSTQEKLEFLDMWYCMMIFNDILIIGGSVLKAAIEQRTVESDQYATCAILLGFGNLLVWAGVLRYLGFFHKYNVLVLTVKRALPNVLRFALCCVLLYAGFCFCGWVVLGPYHIKFRSLATTSECLFAMMNGDDLFATFAITNTNNSLIWWFSRIYLYTFISMFIYVVISLFISVIMDSYETVKDYYRHGAPLSRIQTFLVNYPDDSISSFYQHQRETRKSIWQRVSTFMRP